MNNTNKNESHELLDELSELIYSEQTLDINIIKKKITETFNKKKTLKDEDIKKNELLIDTLFIKILLERQKIKHKVTNLDFETFQKLGRLKLIEEIKDEIKHSDIEELKDDMDFINKINELDSYDLETVLSNIKDIKNLNK